MAKRIAFALAALFLAPAPLQALPRTLLPVEQCSGDRSFVKFRNELKRVVATKDRPAFLALLAPDVLIDFGGASGRYAFQQRWPLDADEYGNVWNQLDRMLALGCARSGKVRVIPSLAERLTAEADEDWIVILPGAKLYKETGVESAHPRTSPWTVAVVTSRAGDLVTGVRLPDGREGFISDDDLYEPLGQRMTIERRQGKWMITAFVAGD